jgi:DNA recombination protein RmuC
MNGLGEGFSMARAMLDQIGDAAIAGAIILMVISLVLQALTLRRSSAGRTDVLRRVDGIDRQLERADKSLRDQIGDFRRELRQAARDQREEVRDSMDGFRKGTVDMMTALAKTQNAHLEGFASGLNALTTQSQQSAQSLRETVERRLEALRADNAEKLEQMRQTVDEKLQGTLEKRLGESFSLVSERLEKVHQGLGEMQNLASGVGDLKRLMTNVKTRGTWGEYQLGAILEQILSPEQYEQNVAVKREGAERVEFAVRLPGGGDDLSAVRYLPIDAKFPSEDYQRLLDAQEAADADAVRVAGKQLENAIKASAKDIRDKYLAPPATTDFAIMFLPTEGLYAEVVRRNGLVEYCQRECRVVVAGPTTFAAILNSLQMGFRTLAIQERSSEVWEVLAGVKTEFGKFGVVLDKVKRKLQEASNTVESAETRTRAMNRRLRAVEALPAGSASVLLGLSANGELDNGADSESADAGLQ